VNDRTMTEVPKVTVDVVEVDSRVLKRLEPLLCNLQGAGILVNSNEMLQLLHYTQQSG
jgi:hypothetical protein